MKRCEHRSHWHDTVFIGETPSGWGLWAGYCAVTGKEGRSLYAACEKFSPKIKPIKDCKGQILMEARPQ